MSGLPPGLQANSRAGYARDGEAGGHLCQDQQQKMAICRGFTGSDGVDPRIYTPRDRDQALDRLIVRVVAWSAAFLVRLAREAEAVVTDRNRS